MTLPADRRLRIAHIVDELAPAGGIEEALVNLAPALRAHGCDSLVLSCQSVAAVNSYMRRLQADGTPVHSLPARFQFTRQNAARLADAIPIGLAIALLPFSLTAIGILVLTRSYRPERAWQAITGRLQRHLPVEAALRRWWQRHLTTWLKRQAADCIHVHGYGCGVVPMWALEAANASGLPVVYTEHGMPWPDLAGRLDLHTCLQACRQVIAISTASAEAMRAHCGASRPIHLVQHSVPDLNPTGHRPLRPASEGLTIGCLAMLRPPKGHMFWLRSMPAVLDMYPQTRFVLAGDGSERPALEAEARRLGITASVTFLGLVDHAQLEEMLQSWDVFVLPSPDEPLGIVLVEAMAAGLPIVAAHAGGVLDLVSHQQTALLVTPADSQALADAQLRLAGDWHLRERLAGAARQAYEHGAFTPEYIGAALAAIYYAALDAAPANAPR